ncbi:MAG: CAP domain-containing protein [Candidatus Promineifilaceae bacterium]
MKRFVTLMGMLVAFAYFQPQMMPYVLAPLRPQSEADPTVDVRRSAMDHKVFVPIIYRPVNGLAVDVTDRAAVSQFYRDHYLGSASPSAGWTGSIGGCVAGDTSAEFKASVAHRINYYRAMAGLAADVKMKPEYNALAQAAALMMSAQNSLSHTPGAGWACYTQTGADGAASSNLALGHNGSSSIFGYMQDRGTHNAPVGHRRWILYPFTTEFGTGDVPATSGHAAANGLMVFGTFSTDRIARDSFVAWPPPGFVPYQVVYPRWSFSLGASGFDPIDFSNATVSMTIDGVATPVVIESADGENDLGYGERAIVWRPTSMGDGASWPRPSTNSVIQIQISNVNYEGSMQSFNYTVTVIDPN